MGYFSDLDLLVREKWDIPDGEDTKEWCEENGLDYNTELVGAMLELKVKAGMPF